MGMRRIFLGCIVLLSLAACNEGGRTDCFEALERSKKMTGGGECTGVGIVENPSLGTFQWKVVGDNSNAVLITDGDYILGSELENYLGKKVEISGKYQFFRDVNVVLIFEISSIEPIPH